MKYASILLLILLSSCAKEQPLLTRVTVRAICGGCTVTYGAAGADKGSEQLSGSREWSWLEAVGNDVRIRAVSTQTSSSATMVMIHVNGFQQTIDFTGKIDSTNLGVAAEASIIVPRLDRFGDPD